MSRKWIRRKKRTRLNASEKIKINLTLLEEIFKFIEENKLVQVNQHIFDYLAYKIHLVFDCDREKIIKFRTQLFLKYKRIYYCDFCLFGLSGGGYIDIHSKYESKTKPKRVCIWWIYNDIDISKRDLKSGTLIININNEENFLKNKHYNQTIIDLINNFTKNCGYDLETDLK